MVGDVGEDSVFSVVRWYQALLAHWPASRDREAPFFLARDKTRPYTYTAAMSDMARMLKKVGCKERYGIHSLRVSGYNWSKSSANGEDLTVAHGMWKSSGHKRYSRWDVSAILDIPANMVGTATIAWAERQAARPPAGFSARQRAAAPMAAAAQAPRAAAPRASTGRRSATSRAQRALRGATD